MTEKKVSWLSHNWKYLLGLFFLIVLGLYQFYLYIIHNQPPDKRIQEILRLEKDEQIIQLKTSGKRWAVLTEQVGATFITVDGVRYGPYPTKANWNFALTENLWGFTYSPANLLEKSGVIVNDIRYELSSISGIKHAGNHWLVSGTERDGHYVLADGKKYGPYRGIVKQDVQTDGWSIAVRENNAEEYSAAIIVNGTKIGTYPDIIGGVALHGSHWAVAYHEMNQQLHVIIEGKEIVMPVLDADHGYVSKFILHNQRWALFLEFVDGMENNVLFVDGKQVWSGLDTITLNGLVLTPESWILITRNAQNNMTTVLLNGNKIAEEHFCMFWNSGQDSNSRYWKNWVVQCSDELSHPKYSIIDGKKGELINSVQPSFSQGHIFYDEYDYETYRSRVHFGSTVYDVGSIPKLNSTDTDWGFLDSPYDETASIVLDGETFMPVPKGVIDFRVGDRQWVASRYNEADGGITILKASLD